MIYLLLVVKLINLKIYKSMSEKSRGEYSEEELKQTEKTRAFAHWAIDNFFAAGASTPFLYDPAILTDVEGRPPVPPE